MYDGWAPDGVKREPLDDDDLDDLDDYDDLLGSPDLKRRKVDAVH